MKSFNYLPIDNVGISWMFTLVKYSNNLTRTLCYPSSFANSKPGKKEFLYELLKVPRKSVHLLEWAISATPAGLYIYGVSLNEKFSFSVARDFRVFTASSESSGVAGLLTWPSLFCPERERWASSCSTRVILSMIPDLGYPSLKLQTPYGRYSIVFPQQRGRIAV